MGNWFLVANLLGAVRCLWVFYLSLLSPLDVCVCNFCFSFFFFFSFFLEMESRGLNRLID